MKKNSTIITTFILFLTLNLPVQAISLPQLPNWTPEKKEQLKKVALYSIANYMVTKATTYTYNVLVLKHWHRNPGKELTRIKNQYNKDSAKLYRELDQIEEKYLKFNNPTETQAALLMLIPKIQKMDRQTTDQFNPIALKFAQLIGIIGQCLFEHDYEDNAILNQIAQCKKTSFTLTGIFEIIPYLSLISAMGLSGYKIKEILYRQTFYNGNAIINIITSTCTSSYNLLKNPQELLTHKALQQLGTTFCIIPFYACAGYTSEWFNISIKKFIEQRPGIGLITTIIPLPQLLNITSTALLNNIFFSNQEKIDNLNKFSHKQCKNASEASRLAYIYRNLPKYASQ